MTEYCIVIPAVKKNVAFPNDLVKKLNGVMLIQRAITRALQLHQKQHVFVVTDSEEISLICQRNGVLFFYDKSLILGEDVLLSIKDYLRQLAENYGHFFLLWPYCPLVQKATFKQALAQYFTSRLNSLISVKRLYPELVRSEERNAVTLAKQDHEYYQQVKSLHIFSLDFLEGKEQGNQLFVLRDDVLEIKSFHDWWVCEKLMRRKRILFRVVGNTTMGLGHIYRALSLAHENTDHEIVFVTDEDSGHAMNRLAGYDYYIEIAGTDEIEEKILQLKPDLVINDMLNTDRDYILKLKANEIRVINFEDLGEGALHADLTINELYDDPQFEGGNVCWGSSYAFLRDEFAGAKVHTFQDEVDAILLTFGGADPSNLTFNVFKSISQYCIDHGLKVFIVCGPGYLYYDMLEQYLLDIQYSGFYWTRDTGVISGYMEKTQIAISSNGRTTYELAHMHIPSIVIAQNEREHTHRFTHGQNGFINLGVYERIEDDEEIVSALDNLINNRNMRRKLFNNMRQFDFLANKRKVVGQIMAMLEDE